MTGFASSTSEFLPMFRAHLYPPDAVTRINGQGMGAFQNGNALSEIGEGGYWTEKYFQLFFRFQG